VLIGLSGDCATATDGAQQAAFIAAAEYASAVLASTLWAAYAVRAHRTRQKLDRLVAGSRWSDSGHVFATMLGKPHHAATITRAFEQALARAELPHTRFHDLRHSAATFLLSQGFGLEDVKNLLGHSTIVLTSNTYGHVLEQRQQEMARGMDAVLRG
jgi:integrase